MFHERGQKQRAVPGEEITEEVSVCAAARRAVVRGSGLCRWIDGGLPTLDTPMGEGTYLSISALPPRHKTNRKSAMYLGVLQGGCTFKNEETNTSDVKGIRGICGVFSSS